VGTITDVEFVRNQGGHAEVTFLFDGERAFASVEQNMLLLSLGFISLHPQNVWREKLGQIDLPANDEWGWPRQRLTGFTTDKDVVNLVQMYAAAVRDGTFIPGPVAWPLKTGS
jgi:hypothetical protein